MSVRGLLEYLAQRIGETLDEWQVDYGQVERSTQLSTTAGGVVVVRPLEVVFARELEPLAGSVGGASHYVVVVGFTAFSAKRATPLEGYDEILGLYRFLSSHSMRRGGVRM